MFYGCSSLKSVDLFNFDFSMIDDMRYMFYECSSLTSLDLINIDTFQVTNMEFLLIVKIYFDKRENQLPLDKK